MNLSGEETLEMKPDYKLGQQITDIYGNTGKIVEVFYDYVRLDNGKHVYKLAISCN
jgi:hypothetical protein